MKLQIMVCRVIELISSLVVTFITMHGMVTLRMLSFIMDKLFLKTLLNVTLMNIVPHVIMLAYVLLAMMDINC